MIGQNRIINELNHLNSLPHSCIIVGDEGSGKHTLLEYISEKFKLEKFNITDKINSDFIDEITLRNLSGLYYIEADTINESEQNKLLKFIEETNDLYYIVILVSNEYKLLTTVLNRCVKYKLDKYTKEELLQLGNYSDLMLEFCDTPGQLQNNSEDKMQELFELCSTIADKIGRASLGNALKILNKISFEEKDNKLNPRMFVKVLAKIYYHRCLTDNSYYNRYLLSNSLYNIMSDTRYKRKDLIEKYLIDLWKESK